MEWEVTEKGMMGPAWRKVLLMVLSLPGMALAADVEPPARNDPRSAVVASDAELWRRIDAAGRTATIGFKAPGARRGVWRGTRLVQDSVLQQGRQAVLSQRGVTLRSEDDQMPRIEVTLEDREAMERVRRLPFIDYVEPARFQMMPLDSSGCENNATGGTPFDQQTIDNMERDSSGDVLPWNYSRIQIQQAWQRQAAGKGEGITVGVVDTGLFADQSQLWNPGFSSGWSTGRDHIYFANYSGDYYDTCNHGTRMAGTIVAPRDGINIVGVAYKANLRASRAVADVYIGIGGPVEPIVNGIRNVIESGARIIVMAWGQASWSEAISDEIRGHYYNRDVLFIGAAGTLVCPPGGIFPADMNEVVSVTGLTDSNTVHSTACGYDSTDIGAVIGDVPTTGRNDSHLVKFGGSSNASALVAGVAALVWSKNPTLNRDQVRTRLYESTGRGYYDWTSGTGWGRVNAFRAIGGFGSLSISESNSEPLVGESVTFTARPKGDGPFTYQWGNGSTATSVTQYCSYQGQVLSASVTVLDLTDGTTKSTSDSVFCGDPGDPLYCEQKPWLCDP